MRRKLRSKRHEAFVFATVHKAPEDPVLHRALESLEEGFVFATEAKAKKEHCKSDTLGRSHV